MKLKEAIKKIEELEQRIKSLEASKPHEYHYHYHYQQQQPNPDPNPLWPTVIYGGGTSIANDSVVTATDGLGGIHYYMMRE